MELPKPYTLDDTVVENVSTEGLVPRRKFVILDAPFFHHAEANRDKIIELMGKAGLATNHHNCQRLEAFSEGNGFLYLYQIFTMLGKTGLNQENFEAITHTPKYVKDIADILRPLYKHHALDISLICYEVICYSPFAASFIKRIPNRRYYSEPSLDYEDFRKILKKIDLEIEEHTKMKTAYLRGFHPEKLEPNSGMSVMSQHAGKHGIADIQTSKIIFSFLFPSKNPRKDNKSTGKKVDFKEIENIENRALFLTLEESPFNPKRVQVLLEPNSEDLLPRAATINAFNPTTEKSFLRTLAEKALERSTEPLYQVALKYLLGRMNNLQEGEKLPVDIRVALGIIEKIPNFVKDNKENFEKLKSEICIETEASVPRGYTAST